MFFAIAAYLVAAGVAIDRSNHRTWEMLSARLEVGSGRYVAFCNAGVLLEMIDYACNAEKPIDASLAEALRSEAMRMRLEAVLAPKRWT